MLKQILFLNCLVYFFSCCSPTGKENIYVENVISVPAPLNISIEQFIESYDTIRIETSDRSLLSGVQQARMMNDKLYIADRTCAFVFIYSLDGKYLSKICNQGQGPNEYLKIAKFEVDPINERLFITDNFSRKLFEYDEYGTLRTITKLDFFPLHFVSDKSNRFIHLNSGPRMYDLQKRNMNFPYNVSIVSKEGNIIQRFLEDETPDRIDITYSVAPSYTKEGELLYMPVLSDIIYRISDNQAIPEYQLTSDCKTFLGSKEKEDIFYTFESNNVVDYERDGYLISFGSFLKSDSLMMFSFGWENKWRTFYSLQEKNSFTIRPDKMSGNKGLCEIFSNFPQFIQGDTFYIAVDPVQISYALPLLPEGKLKTFFESFTEDDNPCIIAYRINKKLFEKGK